jgi:ribonucleoside-diphosphate reductase beta chain
MSQDLQDWDHMPTGDKEIIAGILKGFTLIEARVGCYWADVVAQVFPKPEIRSMAIAFSAQEAVHAYAYNHLESSLGLNTYEAFLRDKSAVKKLALFEVNPSEDIAKSLALFSGAGEGISLFGSFATLLNFCRDGKLKGLKQILSWSVRDEQHHSDMGLFLLSQLGELPPIEWTMEMLDTAVSNEISFIRNSGLETSDIGVFLNCRTDKILSTLYPNHCPRFSDKMDTIGDWFYPLVRGSTHHDFFSIPKNGSAYSAKLTQNFAQIDYSSLI